MKTSTAKGRLGFRDRLLWARPGVACLGLAWFGLVIAVPAAQAAPGDHLWSKGWSVSGTSASIDASGAASCAGSINGTVNFGGGNLTATGTDVFVARYDASGAHIWSGIYDCTSFPQVTAIACSPSGDTYVAGTLPKGGTIDFGGGPIGTVFNDCWAVRFDPAGNHVWSDSYGSGVIHDIDALDTMVAFAARNISTVDFGGGPLGASGNTQAILVQFLPNGSHVFSDDFGDSQFQEAREVGFLPNGDVVLLAAIRGTIDFGGGGLTADANDDFALAKFSAANAHIFSKVFHGQFGSSLILQSGMDVRDTGEIALTGEFTGTVSFGGSTLTSTGFDIFVARLNADGSHAFSARFGGTSTERGMAIWFDGSGNLALAGTYQSTMNFGGASLPLFGSTDAYIASITPTGTHRWSRGLGTTSSESKCEIEARSAGDVVVSLSGGTNVDLGGGALAGTFYVAKYAGDDAVVGLPLGAPPADGLTLEAAPNPFRQETTLRFAVPSTGGAGDTASPKLEILDLAGRRVREFGLGASRNSGSLVWDGRDSQGDVVAPGVYFVRLETGHVRTSAQLVRVR